LAGLDLDEFAGQFEALGLGEPGNGLALAYDGEPSQPSTDGSAGFGAGG
jgi:hypothetical protein